MDNQENIEQKKKNIKANKEVIMDLMYLLHIIYRILNPLSNDKLKYEYLLKQEGVKDVLTQINLLIAEQPKKQEKKQ